MAMGYINKKIGEDWSCGSGDIRVDRQTQTGTNRRTGHNTLHLYHGEVTWNNTHLTAFSRID